MAEKSYTYDGSMITDMGINQMRFELGDVLVEEADKTAYLTDEEITAVINAYPEKWKRAKLELVKSLLYRFAPEVDTQSGPVSWSLSQRYSQWKALYEDLKGSAEASEMAPMGLGSRFRPPYFREGMHDNRSMIGGHHVFTSR